jgi:hypothetical protein
VVFSVGVETNEKAQVPDLRAPLAEGFGGKKLRAGCTIPHVYIFYAKGFQKFVKPWLERCKGTLVKILFRMVDNEAGMHDGFARCPGGQGQHPCYLGDEFNKMLGRFRGALLPNISGCAEKFCCVCDVDPVGAH